MGFLFASILLAMHVHLGLFYNISERTLMTDLVSDSNITSRSATLKPKADDDALWLTLVNAFQTAMTAIGLVLNILTMVTLKLNGNNFKPIIRSLFVHQAFIDMLVCVMAILLITVPPMALPGLRGLDFVICQAFHSQAFYWAVTWISVTSLEVIAWERFMAICYPLKHADISKKSVHLMLFSIYMFSPFATCMSYVQVKYEHGVCWAHFYFDYPAFVNIMRGFSFWCFSVLWAIPCAVFVVFYGSIIYTLVSRQRQTHLAQSRVIDSATKQLTNTAMVVTGWFIIALGYDLWYYVLGYNHVVVYQKNSPVQKVGVFLSGSNSCVNPIIYALFMPAYRASVKRTLGCKKSGNTNKYQTTSMASVSSTVQ